MTKIGRPKKEGINYFSLDVDFDSSLEVILSKYGEKGLGIVIRIWQHIYKTKGYYIPYNEDELYMIKRICNDSVIGEIEDIIKIMIDKNLFSKKLYEEKAILTSKRLQQNYKTAVERRKVDFYNLPYIILESKTDDDTTITGDDLLITLEYTEEELANEIWKDIKGFEGFCKVSNLGRIEKIKQNVITTGTYNIGYLSTYITNGVDKIIIKIHRVVAEHFIPNPENKPLVHHKNENKQDSKATNLEWLTYKEHANIHAQINREDNYCLHNDNDNEQIKLNEIKQNKKKLNTNYSLVVKTWNDLGLCKVMKMTDKRKKHINARILDYGFDKFVGGIKSIKDSKFLMESKETNWLNFDWVLNPNNFIKIVEGKYHKEFTNYSIKEKDLLPKDIESDWLDDYIKNIK